MGIYAFLTLTVGLLLDVVFGRQLGNTYENLKFNFTARNLPNKYTHKRTEKCSGTRDAHNVICSNKNNNSNNKMEVI